MKIIHTLVHLPEPLGCQASYPGIAPSYYSSESRFVVPLWCTQLFLSLLINYQFSRLTNPFWVIIGSTSFGGENRLT